MHLQARIEERGTSERRIWRILLLGLSFAFLVGCGELGELTEVGMPIHTQNRPLSERIADLHDEVEIVVDEVLPETLAFADARDSGTPVLLNITTGPSGTGLYAGPGRGYTEVERLPSGLDVFVTGSVTGEWAQVVHGDVEGWVNTRRLTVDELVEQELTELPDRTEEVTIVLYGVRSGSSGVNIRSAPGLHGSRLTNAPRGAELVATGNTSAHWIEVTYGGTTGWASGNYIVQTGTRTETREIQD